MGICSHSINLILLGAYLMILYKQLCVRGGHLQKGRVRLYECFHSHTAVRTVIVPNSYMYSCIPSSRSKSPLTIPLAYVIYGQNMTQAPASDLQLEAKQNESIICVVTKSNMCVCTTDI